LRTSCATRRSRSASSRCAWLASNFCCHASRLASPRQPGCRFADLQWRQAVRRQQRRPVPREFLRVAGERGGALAVEIEGSLHL